MQEEGLNALSLCRASLGSQAPQVRHDVEQQGMGAAGLAAVLAALLRLLCWPHTLQRPRCQKILLRLCPCTPCLLTASGAWKGLETRHEGGQELWAHSLQPE